MTPALLRINRKLAFGSVALAIIGLTAILGPILYPTDPWAIVGRSFVWPSQSDRYPLGTDVMGRDVLAGLIGGARVSVLIGLGAMLTSVGIGVVLGGIAGYRRGWIDDLLMRVTEVFQTVPAMLLVIVLVAIFKPTALMVIVSIAVVSWPPVARIVRSEVLSLREREFVQSCITIGMGHLRIIFTQILPNCMGPVIVMSSILMATAILIEAGLSFLGLSDPNVMSWGTMIGNGRESLRSAWYLSAIPGIAIFTTVLALNLFAEGLNDEIYGTDRSISR